MTAVRNRRARSGACEPIGAQGAPGVFGRVAVRGPGFRGPLCAHSVCDLCYTDEGLSLRTLPFLGVSYRWETLEDLAIIGHCHFHLRAVSTDIVGAPLAFDG